MKTFYRTTLALSLLSLTWLWTGAAEARRMVPKYDKNAIASRVQQGHKLRNKSLNSMRTRSAIWAQTSLKRTIRPAVKPSPARTTIKDSTTRAYISRSLHKQAGMNYYLHDQNVRVNKVKVDSNVMMIKDGGKYLAWTARVSLPGGDSYSTRGMIRQKLQGGPRGQARVQIQSSTPTPGIIVR